MTHVDVLVVGAGLSGIGAACRLRTRSPDRTFAVLEARDAIGGTWDLFRYPGVRSDSDMVTLAYPFRPWRDARSIADGPSILRYIRDTAAEYGVDRDIRFGHRVVRASWSSPEGRWTVVADVDGAEPVTYTCAFLYLCSGYYSYGGGHVVEFPGQDRFRGTVVHPQRWPPDLDHHDKRVVVIGSGATAITLVPALAPDAARVTMLQRSPGYVMSLPAKDPLAERLRAWLPERLAHRVIRGRSLALTTLSYQLCRLLPERTGTLLRARVARQLPDSIPVDPHFVPRYAPWDQRMCVAPGGDLFRALRSGRADVVTDEIDTFTESGVRLRSGRALSADIVVTATGLRMVAFGEVDVTVDGAAVDPGRTVVYKGMMFGGVPNLAWCVGYVNNSWTLRADLTSRHVCRLLNHMWRHGYTTCRPEADSAGAARAGADSPPILDLTSGYVQRAAAVLPRQGRRRPWRVRQNYVADLVAMRLGRVDDRSMRFTRSGPGNASLPYRKYS